MSTLKTKPLGAQLLTLEIVLDPTLQGVRAGVLRMLNFFLMYFNVKSLLNFQVHARISLYRAHLNATLSLKE